MGGHIRLLVIAASALATFAVASPLTVVAAPSALHHGEGAAVKIERAKPRANQPAERADHASSRSEGRHDGAGDDEEQAVETRAADAAVEESLSPSPSASAEAAATSLVDQDSGGPPAASTPPPVIIEPPGAPQPRPIATPQALTAARLDWILVGVVVLLAACVAAAVRLAAFRGRRPSR